MTDRSTIALPVPLRFPLRSARVSLLAWLLSCGSGIFTDAVHAEQAVAEPPPDLILDAVGRKKSRALALYYRALRLEDNLDIPAALTLYREVLKLDPSHVDLAQKAANLSAAYSKFDEAIALLEASLKHNGNDPRAHMNLAAFCETYREVDPDLKDRALASAEAALQKFPRNTEVADQFISLLLARNERTRAEEILQGTIAKGDDDAGFHLRMGRLAQKVWPLRDDDANRQRVNGLYEKAFQHGADDYEIAFAVGRYFSNSRQYERARGIFESIVETFPESLRIRESLHYTYKQLGEPDKALEALEALVRIDPHRAETQRDLSDMHKDAGNLDKSLEHFRRYLELAQPDAEDHETYWEMLTGAERHTEALEAAERAARLFPDQLTFPWRAAQSHTALDQHSGAIGAYLRTEEIAKAGGLELGTGFYYEFGGASDRAGDQQRAADLLRKAIELVPEDRPELAARPLNYLGYMWLEQNVHIEEAGGLIRKAASLEPESGMILDSLGWYRFKAGRFDEALEQLERAAKLLKKPDPEVLSHIAQTYFSLGQKDRALEVLKRAVSLDADNIELKALLERFEK